MAVTIDQINRSFNFSLNAYVSSKVQGDYYELFLYSDSGNTKDVVITDLTWYVEAH
jgi:hypothetical protein